MNSTPASPPRTAEWLASHLAGRRHWDDVMAGDLAEEHAAVAATRGRVRARLWYWREVLDLAAALAGRATRRITALLSSLIRPQGNHVMRSLFQELRPAVRTLSRQPMMVGIIVITLGLGLGTNVAVFGLADSLLLRPFDFENLDEMVMFAENSPDNPFPTGTVAPAHFLEWREQLDGVTNLSAYWDRSVSMARSGPPERVAAAYVTADFFSLLGATPTAGRLLVEQDEVWGEHRQAVLGHALWVRLFGSDPSVVGQVVQVDGQSYTVVGIGPPEFVFPTGSEMWLSLAFSPQTETDRVNHYLTAFARLAPGVTFEQVESRITAIYDRQQAEHEGDGRDRRMVVRWFNDGMIDVGLVPILGLWQATAFLILLIACANVANLLLARGAARQREMALRLAIGAGRMRLIRQLLVESVVLALAAVPAALVVAAMTFGALRGAMPAELVKYVPGWTEMGVDLRVGLVTVGAAVLATIFFGLLPAIQASRPGLSNTLKDGGRSSVSPARSRLRRGLVVAEVALAMPLLVASGMSAIGAQRFSSGPQGYEPNGVLSLRVSLPTADYPDADSRRQFAERLIERVRRVPGVDGAATASVVPSTANNQRANFEVDGMALDADAAPPLVNYRAVSPGYLELLQIPLQEGRTLSSGDLADAERVAVVSRAAADRFWPGESAIGQRVRVGTNPTGWTVVVGVVGDTIDDWFNARNVPTIFVPHDQRPASAVSLVTRSAGDPAVLATPVREALADVDATLAPSDVMPLTEAIKLRTTGIKFVGGIMAAFGFIALALATLGIYGVMAYFVAQRRREIGIRMALGASTREVLLQTVTRGGRMAALGIAIGLGLAVLLARLIESALFGAVAIEPWLFVTIASVLAAVALAASIMPARSAARVDPVVALRTD